MKNGNVEQSNQSLLKKYPINDQNMSFKTQVQEQLLQKRGNFHAFPFQIDGSQHKKSDQTQSLSMINGNYRKQYQQYCYPKFLNILGNCMTPFLIIFPFLRCQNCCENQPLFQQNMQNYGLLQRWGTYQKVLKPGLHVINPISQKVIQINRQTKILQFDQIVFTKDNVQFKIDSVIFYRIVNSHDLAYKLGISQGQAYSCVKQISQACLRNICGVNTIQQIIEKRQIMANKLKQQINQNLNRWGIYIQSCALKQIILSQDIKNYLESAAITKRKMQAQIINYQSQVQIGKLIKDVSEILSIKSAFQIRYLQTVQQIIQQNNNNVIMVKTELDQQNFF